MIDEFITKVGNAIRDAFGSVFSFDWIPEIWFWYWWLFLLFLVCGVIIWFFGWSKIVRMIASVGFAFAAAFVAGAAVYAHRMKERDKLNVATKPKPPPVMQPEARGGPWKWPWES